MKKYNKPEIKALALETVDVIAISGAIDAANKLSAQYDLPVENVKIVGENIAEMGNQWSW